MEFIRQTAFNIFISVLNEIRQTNITEQDKDSIIVDWMIADIILFPDHWKSVHPQVIFI